MSDAERIRLYETIIRIYQSRTPLEAWEIGGTEIHRIAEEARAIYERRKHSGG